MNKQQIQIYNEVNTKIINNGIPFYVRKWKPKKLDKNDKKYETWVRNS